MTSTVDIANSALNLLGASNIAAFDENSKAARVINKNTLAYVTICFVNIPGIAWSDAQL